MKKGYTEVFRSDDAAEKYDEVVYAPGTAAALINDRQRAFLRRLVRSRFGDEKPVQHDFACGTGRAIENLEGHVSAAYGYDSAVEMITRARERKLPGAFRVVPADGPVPDPMPTSGPAIVTVFRLFLNVGPDVRDRAVAFAAKVLTGPDSGVLVIENHGNSRSLRHLSARRKRGDEWFNELSHREVRETLERHGFTIESMRGFALVPKGAHRPRWLRPIARAADAIGSRMRLLAPYSRCVLYVARRTG
jgi:hypothetical protein